MSQDYYKNTIRVLTDKFFGEIHSSEQWFNLAKEGNNSWNFKSFSIGDWCYNNRNKMSNEEKLLSEDKRAFIMLGDGQFQFVGENYKFNGFLTRKSKKEGQYIYGDIVNGKPVKREKELSLSLERYKEILYAAKQLFYTDSVLINTKSELEEVLPDLLKKVTRKIPPIGQTTPAKINAHSTTYQRDAMVVAWVLKESEGICELCDQKAPFEKKDGTPYLEVHHVQTLANHGRDTVDNAVALCPNCHRKLHYAKDADQLIKHLREKCKRLRG